MTNETLQKLNLDEKEIKLFLELQKTGVQSVQQISEQSLINRTTAYRVLESLEEKGLVEWIVDDQGRKVKASPPERLSNILSEQKRKITELEGELPSLIEQMKMVQPSMKLTTEVRYYKGESGIRQMIWNSLHAKETARSYAALRRREYIDPKFEKKFEEEWVRRKLKDKVIVNEPRTDYIKNQMVRSYRKTLELKIIPKEKYYLTNDIIIYNNILSIMSLEHGNLVGVEIENAEIAKTQKSLFDIVWEVAKPLK